MPISKDEQEEIDRAKQKSFSTRRPTVPALEAMLFDALPVLDHGFVRVVDYMGDDSSIVQAARVSYGTGTRRVTDDTNLIRYLLRHSHTTPFEMAEIKVHVKLPIFVARQWIRHRTASVNEYSARYSILDKEFYIPAASQLAAQSATNRQGRGDVLDTAEASWVLNILKSDAENAYTHYLELLNEGDSEVPRRDDRSGIARELARMNLSLNFYTQWYWKINLHNFMHFLRLRADPHAQYEIRAYAEQLLKILKAWCPITYAAFLDYRLHSVSLSKAGVEALKNAINGLPVTQVSSGLTKREWDELNSVFKLENKEV